MKTKKTIAIIIAAVIVCAGLITAAVLFGSGIITCKNTADTTISATATDGSTCILRRGENNPDITYETTVNTALNEKLYSIMKEAGIDTGSCSVIDAATGEIISLISINEAGIPCEIESGYNDYLDHYDGNLAALPMHPGPVAKTLTTISAIENDINPDFYDTGELSVGGQTINNADYNKYGYVDLESAYCKSPNTYFAYLGTLLGAEKLNNTFGSFRIGKDIELDFSDLTSCGIDTENPDDYTIATDAIGMGDVQVSPFQMAMTQAAIINKGTMMTPHLVKSAKDTAGNIYFTYEPEVLATCTNEKTADTMKEMMYAASESLGFEIEDAGICLKHGYVSEADRSMHSYAVFSVEKNGKAYAGCISRIYTDSSPVDDMDYYYFTDILHIAEKTITVLADNM